MLFNKSVAKASAAFYDYTIDQSCRLNDNDLAKMTRTQVAASTNPDIFTMNVGTKRGNLGLAHPIIIESYQNATNYGVIKFNADNRLLYYDVISGVNYGKLYTQRFRDPASHYNIHITVDTSEAAAADRLKVYVNGVQVTAVFTDYGDYALNQNSWINVGSSISQTIGYSAVTATYYDGYLSEFHLIDGQALTPAAFGEFKNNIWVPIAYAGTFGDNGFYLPFSNSSDFGSDQSGNANDFTGSGLATNDQVSDTPTDNYCVLNGIHPLSTGTLANGNLECSGTENEYGTISLIDEIRSWEITVNENGSFGIEATDGTEVVAADISGEVVEMLLDLSAGTLKKKVDGGSIEDIDLSLDLTKTWYPYFKAACAVDFGQLGYTPTESGYKTIKSSNMTDPTIADSADGCVTDSDTGANIPTALAALRSGWGSYIDIFKNLSAAESWDIVFSDDLANSMHFDTTAAKGAKQSLVAGNTYSGTSLRVGSGYGLFTTEVSHTNGADTDTAHSLGTCDVGIAKRSNDVGSWYMTHPSLTADYNILIDDVAVETSTQYVDVDSVNITIKSSAPTGTYRLIAIKDVTGLFKAGTHTGNGSADGPVADSGGRIAVGMFKNEDAADNWLFFIDERLGYNVDNNETHPNDNSVEGTTDFLDLISNGYKVRSTSHELNASGEVYISLTWLAQSKKYSNAR